MMAALMEKKRSKNWQKNKMWLLHIGNFYALVFVHKKTFGKPKMLKSDGHKCWWQFRITKIVIFACYL